MRHSAKYLKKGKTCLPTSYFPISTNIVLFTCEKRRYMPSPYCCVFRTTVRRCCGLLRHCAKLEAEVLIVLLGFLVNTTPHQVRVSPFQPPGLTGHGLEIN